MENKSYYTILREMRKLYWSRAITELNDMLFTFRESDNSLKENQYEDLDKLVDKFIIDIESNGLHE